jgi:hypothetical protein
MLVPERGDPTTKMGLFMLSCISPSRMALRAAPDILAWHDQSYMRGQVLNPKGADRQSWKPGTEAARNSDCSGKPVEGFRRIQKLPPPQEGKLGKAAFSTSSW